MLDQPSMVHKNYLNQARPSTDSLTIVIKIGTSSICDEKTHFPLLSNLSMIVETILQLKARGHRVVLVSSAAVGTGLRRLNIDVKPKKLAAIQAIAAVGQGRLMSLYDDLFGQFNQPIAQILLTKNDLADRSQYLNAVNCFEELLDMGVVPIVNENDTISSAEIRFGDNDSLSAIAAGMVKADYLFLMTDVDCLYTDNPRTNPLAEPVWKCDDIQALREKIVVSAPGTSLGTGGMVTKLIAAELATAAGVTTVIARGSTPHNILKIITDESELPLHTRFTAQDNPLIDRKWWILHGLKSAGAIFVDKGAYHAIVAKQRSSLLAAGIVKVEGEFAAQQSALVVHETTDESGQTKIIEIGKGLVNYSSIEIALVKGHKSSEIADILGYVDSDCIMNRDNLVIIAPRDT
ncbi:Glutamate 5-kinase [Umbelopsis sp. WA50703]